jgi:hypothetical protein
MPCGVGDWAPVDASAKSAKEPDLEFGSHPISRPARFCLAFAETAE